MKKESLIFGTAMLALCACHQAPAEEWKSGLRAPAYPLVTIDPYTSAWSAADRLYDAPVTHWTGKSFPLLGVARVDGKIYRFLGKEELDLIPLAGSAEVCDWEARYTTSAPAEGWEQPGFKDGKWKSGSGAFGMMQHEPTARTQWDKEYVWVRRDLWLDEPLKGRNVFLEYSHDDDVTIYINGVKVVDTGNACNKNVLLKLPSEVVEVLKPGGNLIAACCHDRGGSALLDFGLYVEREDSRLFPETAEQIYADMQATQTHYRFACGEGVELDVTFTAPLLMDDLDLMARPVNYLTYTARSVDGRKHDVQLYFEAGPQWALNRASQLSVSRADVHGELAYACTGSVEQPVLLKQGDDLRIDWGYFYMAAEKRDVTVATGDGLSLRRSFRANGELKGVPTEGRDKLAMLCPLALEKEAEGFLMLAYDDLYSIQYFGQNLRPYWNRQGHETIFTQLEKARAEHDGLMERCGRFDRSLMADADRVGGRRYAELCALAYRQSLAAHKLVESPEGELLYLSKENFSNGCINTVDLTYPSAPLFLLYNPELLKGMMNGIFQYSESGRWEKPFAAHDLGTYPLANGQVYGGDMPVEESGNMLILAAAIAAVEGNADYAERHWTVLTTWADYLVEKGLDPENQLCTDDFAGHFAHNANLSIKAILGIAGYGRLAGMLGKTETEERYLAKAREMAAEWERMADDGDHYRLTFDQPGTWSQKYNLVWDRLLDLNIFNSQITVKEIAYYLTKQNPYGLPLDNRESYTKSDWIMWTGVLASDKETFEQFVSPVYDFMNQTTDRIPMSDWSWTLEPLHRGFRARSVVGGYFMKLLEEKLTLIGKVS